MAVAGAETGAALAGRPSMLAFERLVLRLVEPVAAALVVVEVAVLSAGVFSRYVVNRPLLWSDELASALFLWLAMLGAVIALGRGEHMRLTAVVAMAPARVRPWLDAFGLAVTAACMLTLVPPALEHVRQQWDVTTPGLRIPDGLRVSAILVGGVLMAILAVLRLASRVRPLHAVGATAAVLLVCAGLWQWQEPLTELGNANLVLFFIVLVGVCVFAGTPIAFAFGAASLAYLATTTDMPLSIVVDRIDEGTSELILLAVPMFILLGLLIELMGLAQALIGFMVALLGHVRGGLSYALLAGMYLVSGISGSKAADMAAIAPSLFPGMKRRGAEPGELVAQLAASGAMSETIPPSLVLITIGSSAGVSIAGLFTGGLLPAAVGALALVVVVRLRTRGDRPGRRPPAAAIARSLVIALPALVLPFLIRAAVVDGIATATEVSTVGIAYTIVAGLLLYRTGSWARVYPMLTATAALAGAILLIIGMATAMAWSLTQSGFSQTLVETMKAVPGGRAGFMAVSVVAFAILGSVLEGIPAIVLLGPLLFPAARALGVHDVHYAMTVVLAMGLGLFAPPFGVGFYFSCAIGGATPDEAWGRVWPYLGALLLAVIVVAAVPWLSIGFL
ncbi:MAG: TRAP transporter large permease subunit [Acetobacteraceae bacterium]